MALAMLVRDAELNPFEDKDRRKAPELEQKVVCNNKYVDFMLAQFKKLMESYPSDPIRIIRNIPSKNLAPIEIEVLLARLISENPEWSVDYAGGPFLSRLMN